MAETLKIKFDSMKRKMKKNDDASNRSYSIIAHICTWVKMNMDHSILNIYQRGKKYKEAKAIGIKTKRH